MTFDEWIKQAIFTQEIRSQDEWMRIAFNAATHIEREACANVCDESASETSSLWEPGCWAHAASYCSHKIRMRYNVKSKASGE